MTRWLKIDWQGFGSTQSNRLLTPRLERWWFRESGFAITEDSRCQFGPVRREAE